MWEGVLPAWSLPIFPLRALFLITLHLTLYMPAIPSLRSISACPRFCSSVWNAYSSPERHQPSALDLADSDSVFKFTPGGLLGPPLTGHLSLWAVLLWPARILHHSTTARVFQSFLHAGARVKCYKINCDHDVS